MNKKITINTHKIIYQGYVALSHCELSVPSMKPNSNSHTIKQLDIIEGNDSVLVLLYAPEIDSFILCQQFRAGVFFNHDKHNPYILECVAGRIEQGNTPEETAHKEVYEETGLTLDSLTQVAIAYKSPGVITEKSYIYYATVLGAPKSGVFGVDDEEIQTHIIPKKTAYHYLDEFKIVDLATLAALNWFRATHP